MIGHNLPTAFHLRLAQQRRRRSVAPPHPSTRAIQASHNDKEPSSPPLAMLTSIRNAAVSALHRQLHRFFPPAAPQFSLAGCHLDSGSATASSSWWSPATETTNTTLEDSLWFAVPKSKVSRGKKRMKTTLQKAIKKKDSIVIDKRTGELTLKHRLPYNWKNYLPGNAEHAP